jgi:hypothetical protein
MFKRGRNDNGILDENFFGNNRSFAERELISKLKFDDFFVRGRPKSLHQINLDSGVEFDLNCYMRVHESLQFYVTNRRDDEPVPDQSVGFFLKTFTKGSRPYRRILEYNINSKENLTQNNTVATFFRLLNTEVFDETLLKKSWGMWNNTFFLNTQREFLFKYFNNILGINARVSKFVAGHPSECTFCVTSGEPLPINTEGFVHLFFDCQHSEKYRSMAEAEFFPEIAGENEQKRKIFWILGLVPDGNGYKSNLFMQSTVLTFNFLLWKMKLGKTMVPVSIFKSDFIYKSRCLLFKSVKLREARTNDHFFCAGISSEMADANPNIEDPRLDSSTDGEEDGPDARQRRRERREAKKNLIVDEAVLDESEEEEEEEEEVAATPMEQGTGENNAPPQQSTSAATAEPLVPDPTPATAEEAPPAAGQAVTGPAPDTAVSDSGASHSGITGEKKIEIEKNNALLKKPIETVILNFSTEANQSGADVQLSTKAVNHSGAAGGGEAKP